MKGKMLLFGDNIRSRPTRKSISNKAFLSLLELKCILDFLFCTEYFEGTDSGDFSLVGVVILLSFPSVEIWVNRVSVSSFHR